MKILAIALTCILVAGCGTTSKVTSSSARTVSVQSFKGMQDAQNLADKECAKTGRYARWVSGDLDYIFDCIQ
jgi:outer membrane murein-binding lipoprotein Lpp